VNRLRMLFGILVSFMLISSAYAVADYSEVINIFKGSPTVKPFFENSYGYAVFPTIGKGAVGIGGAYGKGQVYRGGKVTGYTSMKQLTIGFQLGGQSYSEIIFFQNKAAYDKFITGEFEFGAQATAVAITAGASAKAGTGGATAGANVGKEPGAQESSYSDGMAIFTHVKGGLMYEASIGGQKFRFKPL
jgi:lipid-binding SYLF domain-containing protein